MTIIVVKDESEIYDLSLYVYERCAHYKTYVETVEVNGGTDELLRCRNCEMVLESLNDLRSQDYDDIND